MPAIARVGVVGAGQMGNGIAHACTVAGIAVTLSDVRDDLLENARTTMGRNMDRQVSRGTLSAEDRADALGRLTTVTDPAAFGACDLVIEAATENEAVKRTIFAGLTPHLSADCLLATNTSSLSITRLGAATDRPGRFIGMHFFNPVPMMKLVEIIRGIATEDATYEAVRDLAVRLGKSPALAADFPGFMVNRILVPMINEAVVALHEGVGTVAAIDGAMKLGANHPMGPLELADYIGLDTCLSVMRVLHAELGDGKYRPCPLLVKYVEAGWHGRKSGRGFYDYGQDPPRPTR